MITHPRMLWDGLVRPCFNFRYTVRKGSVINGVHWLTHLSEREDTLHKIYWFSSSWINRWWLKDTIIRHRELSNNRTCVLFTGKEMCMRKSFAHYDFTNWVCVYVPVFQYQGISASHFMMFSLEIYHLVLLTISVACTYGNKCNSSIDSGWSPKFDAPSTILDIYIEPHHRTINVWPNGIFSHGFTKLKVSFIYIWNLLDMNYLLNDQKYARIIRL